METEQRENQEPYIMLDRDNDEENQLFTETDKLYTVSISSYSTNDEPMCIICFNEDISMDLMYKCTNCNECLICRECIIKIIFKKNTCPVCRSKNWCKNSNDQLVIFKHNPKKKTQRINQHQERYDSLKTIICTISTLFIIFVVYYYGMNNGE